MAEADESVGTAAERALALKRMQERLDMLDQRLDNIDSMVSAVAERVMSQLITINVICPHCGRDVEIAIVSSQKPTHR